MSYRKRVYCSVFGCLESNAVNSDLSFFAIPKNPERRAEWLRLISREDLIDNDTSIQRVCESHFDVNDVVKTTQRRRLNKNAVPRFNLPVDTSSKRDQETQTVETQNTTNIWIETCPIKSENRTETASSFSADNVVKIKLEPLEPDEISDQMQVEQVQRQTESQKDIFHKLCDRFLAKELAALVKAENYLKSNHKGDRTLEYKMFCLNLYHISPQAYQLLQKTTSLPRKTTLSKLYIPMSTQVSDTLMETLKIKVDKMSAAGKQCTIVVDAMRLKTNLFYDIKSDKIIGFQEVDGMQTTSPAKYALVVLVQGIFVKWSQPIGFALISECKNDDSISKWIDKLVSKLFEMGLKVRAFVSNLESHLLNAAKRRISTNQTYFNIDGHKIYYIFDAPQLMKLVRNNLMTYDFHFQGATAKFDHIVKFYDCDKNKTLKKAYKLTNSHINPSKLDKTKVGIATQLLSRSVATGLSTYVDFCILHESARHTAKFIILMNDLFDVLNSSTIRHSYKHKRAFHGEEGQIKLLNDMLLLFKTLKLVNPKNGHDETKSAKFIQGFQITIKSILQLYQDLNQEGHKHLLTRRLNQDIIGKFFRKIRSETGKTEPTSRQFISVYRKIYFADPPKENSAKDMTKFLTYIEDFRARVNVSRNVILPIEQDALREVIRADYLEFDIPEENALMQVCGALLKKCGDLHDCVYLQTYLDLRRQICNSDVESATAAAVKTVIVPTKDFVESIQSLEAVFYEAFQKPFLNPKIGLSIYKDMSVVQLSVPCSCFPKQYMKKLFIRMRIYSTLKLNNQGFKSPRNRRKCFKVANL